MNQKTKRLLYWLGVWLLTIVPIAAVNAFVSPEKVSSWALVLGMLSALFCFKAGIGDFDGKKEEKA